MKLNLHHFYGKYWENIGNRSKTHFFNFYVIGKIHILYLGIMEK